MGCHLPWQTETSVIHRATHSLAHSPKETPCLRKLSPTCHPGEGCTSVCLKSCLPKVVSTPCVNAMRCVQEAAASSALMSTVYPESLSPNRCPQCCQCQDFRPCHIYCLEEHSHPSNPVRLMCPGCFSAPHDSSKNRVPKRL